MCISIASISSRIDRHQPNLKTSHDWIFVDRIMVIQLQKIESTNLNAEASSSKSSYVIEQFDTNDNIIGGCNHFNGK